MDFRFPQQNKTKKRQVCKMRGMGRLTQCERTNIKGKY